MRFGRSLTEVVVWLGGMWRIQSNFNSGSVHVCIGFIFLVRHAVRAGRPVTPIFKTRLNGYHRKKEKTHENASTLIDTK
jgi:hypothetical protein